MPFTRLRMLRNSTNRRFRRALHADSTRGSLLPRTALLAALAGIGLTGAFVAFGVASRGSAAVSSRYGYFH